MIRVLARIRALLLLVCMLGFASVVHATDRIDTLAYRLAHDDDFRVRTQAALALGATHSTRAVHPLCGGLDDSNTAFELGAAEYIRKPFDMVALLENVRALA